MGAIFRGSQKHYVSRASSRDENCRCDNLISHTQCAQLHKGQQLHIIMFPVHAHRPFNRLSQFLGWATGVLLFLVCVCVCWSVCVGCEGGAGFLSVLSWVVCYTHVFPCNCIALFRRYAPGLFYIGYKPLHKTVHFPIQLRQGLRAQGFKSPHSDASIE